MTKEMAEILADVNARRIGSVYFYEPFPEAAIELHRRGLVEIKEDIDWLSGPVITLRPIGRGRPSLANRMSAILARKCARDYSLFP